MAQRGPLGASGDGGPDPDPGTVDPPGRRAALRPVTSPSGVPRVVRLRPASRPSPVVETPQVEGRQVGDPSEPWGDASSAGWDDEPTAVPLWSVDAPEPPRSASALAESVFPFGTELPWDPDPEAAAFLNAPRRPLSFHVAPFGTPPFGVAPPPAAVPRVAPRRVAEPPAWGPAYPAGA